MLYLHHCHKPYRYVSSKLEATVSRQLQIQLQTSGKQALQDRFKDWESSGVRIIPVLSRPDGRWKGECGNVQVLILMRNLTVNLTSPDFEDHRKLIASYDVASREVVKCGSANNSIKADETMNPLVVAAPEPATAAATTAPA